MGRDALRAKIDAHISTQSRHTHFAPELLVKGLSGLPFLVGLEVVQRTEAHVG